MVQKLLLYFLLLMTVVSGQTPIKQRQPTSWFGQNIGLSADYCYRVTKIFNGTTKYYWKINYYFLYFDFNEDWCTYSVYLTFSCPGKPDIKLSWYGDSTTLGTNSQEQNLNSEVVGATIYRRDHSPLFEGWKPAGGFQLCQYNTVCRTVGNGGSTTAYWAQIPGPIMGMSASGNGWQDYSVTFLDDNFMLIFDLAWCQNEKIPDFTIMSGQYTGYEFQMGNPVLIPVDHTYHSWDFYSSYCLLTMEKLSITHRIHKDEANLSQDYLNIRLWNEQAWMGVDNVGTTPKYQILPQLNTCAFPMWDCLSQAKMGGVCVTLDANFQPLPLPNNFAPTNVSPQNWTPDCNQDMTTTHSFNNVVRRNTTNDVISYTQNPKADNRRGVITLATVNPWREGIHTMRLRIYNANSYYKNELTTATMPQDIQFRVRHNCQYTFIQYNTTYKSWQGRIQPMTVPVSTTLQQDLKPCFSHTYAYRWPIGSCKMGFQIIQGPSDIMTENDGVLTVYTSNLARVGLHSFDIKVFIIDAPSIFWNRPMAVTITGPCNIVSYKVFKTIPADTRYVIGLFQDMPLEFSFTFLNTPCDLWQWHWFTVTKITRDPVTNIETYQDISTTQKFLSIQQDEFPVAVPKYPRLVVQSHVIADRGTYNVKVYAELKTTPVRPSEDFISFTLTMDVDKCLLTYFDDQVFADQTFNIDLNQPPTLLVYKQFEDWVTRDAGHPCGPRKYELSATGGGITGKYLPTGALPAVPNLIKFQTNNAQTCIIQVETIDPYAVGEYTVQMIISLQNWPLYYNIQKLVKTWKVTIGSVCLTKSEILYSTFPLLLHKVAFTVPVTANTFTFNPIPDLLSSIYLPKDGVTFCGQRAYSGFRLACSDCIPVIPPAVPPSALITYPGTVFTLDPTTFMYVKTNPTTDTTFKVDTQSQHPNQRNYWGLYTLYFKVGFLHYPTFASQEFHFPAQIVPDCQNAIITGAIISNMRTYINTAFSATYALSSHNEYNVYNYYCDNALSTGGITYTLLNGSGLDQTYLTMTVTSTGILLTLNTLNPAYASTVPYAHSIKQCLTYYPTNCINIPFTATLDADCSVKAYDSIDPPKLQETYQVGQATVFYPITFQTTFDPLLGPTNCVYLKKYWQVMVDGVDRTNNMPVWLTTTLTQMAITSSSSADVGKYVIKIFGFIDKIPVFPTNLITQRPTQVTIDIMNNPCVNTRIQQTLQGLNFSYMISYNTFPVLFTNPGYTDVVSLSGAANCGAVLYTVTEIPVADYSKYMTFTVDGRTNTVTFAVSTTDASLIGVHNFKVRATLQQFPSLDPMLGIDNYFSITIGSSCTTDVIFRPQDLPYNITTTVDSPSKSYVFQPVQDSISQNVGITNLPDSGGLCGPWAFDIRVGNFYTKDYALGGSYVLSETSPTGLAIVAPGRTLVIDGKSKQIYVGKQEIYITVVSTVYPTIKNEFEVNVWVYNFCSKTDDRFFFIPNNWLPPKLIVIQGGDQTQTTFKEWQLQTDLDYFQDWGVSYDYICGPRNFKIVADTSDQPKPILWIKSSMVKNDNNVGLGYNFTVSLKVTDPAEVKTHKFFYCANLVNFSNKNCTSEFQVVVRDQNFTKFNKQPYFSYVTFIPGLPVQRFNKTVNAYVFCNDAESTYDQLEVQVFINTNAKITVDTWKSRQGKFLGINFTGGVLNWNLETEDYEKKTATLTITCSDGQYTIQENIFIEIEQVKKTKDGASSLNNQTFKFENNRPEKETVKLNETLATKILALVQVGGRNYTLIRPTVYIKSIDNQGLVTLRFSEDMVFKAKIEIDQDLMKKALRVEYVSGFYGDEIGWDKNLNNLKWVVSGIDQREMYLQLKWAAPGWISQGSSFDKLRVTFLEAGAFVNIVGTSIQAEETLTRLEYFLQAQIDQNARSTRNAGGMSKSLGTAGSTLVVSGIAMSIILGIGMAEIWGMINGVQLLIFSPALRLKMPANAQLFIANIIQLATFDYIPMDQVFEKQFDLSNYVAVNPYLNAVGLDTSWFILNMGSPWLFLAFAVVGVALLPILTLLSNKSGLLKNQVASLKKQLMWSYFILFMTSMSLEISLACMIQFQKLVLKFQSIDEKTGRVLQTEDGSSPFLAEIISTYSALIVGGVFVIFNVMTPVFLYRNFRNLAHPVVKGPWGAIYSDVKIEKWSLFYPNILMAKRIVFAVVLMYFTVNGFMQVLILKFLSVFSFIYLGQVRPMHDPLSMLFETVNEIMVILLSYGLMMFNDFLNPDQREWMGWYLCGIVGIYLCLHLTRLAIKKFWQLVKIFKNRCFKWQINRLIKAKQQLLITQLKAQNQVEPEIELPGISPRFQNLKFRRRKNDIFDEDGILSLRQQIGHVLSQAEADQLARGEKSQLVYDADAGVFDTKVLYHLNQPFDQPLNLQAVGTFDARSEIMSSVDSIAVDSSSSQDVSFRQTDRQSWFVIPEMPNEDILGNQELGQ